MKLFSKLMKGMNKMNNNVIVNESYVRGKNVSMTTRGGSTKLNINGRKYEIPSGNVTMIGNRIFVNGEPYNLDDPDIKKADITTVINLVVEGDAENIECNGGVMVTGTAGDINTAGDVTVGKNSGAINTTGDVEVKGNVTGHINTVGDVEVNGDCSGNISTMGDVVVRSNRR